MGGILTPTSSTTSTTTVQQLKTRELTSKKPSKTQRLTMIKNLHQSSEKNSNNKFIDVKKVQQQQSQKNLKVDDDCHCKAILRCIVRCHSVSTHFVDILSPSSSSSSSTTTKTQSNDRLSNTNSTLSSSIGSTSYLHTSSSSFPSASSSLLSSSNVSRIIANTVEKKFSQILKSTTNNIISDINEESSLSLSSIKMNIPLLIAAYTDELHLVVAHRDYLPSMTKTHQLTTTSIPANSILYCALRAKTTTSQLEEKQHFALVIKDDDNILHCNDSFSGSVFNSTTNNNNDNCDSILKRTNGIYSDSTIQYRCYLFSVDESASMSHWSHSKLASEFGINCTADPINGNCLEFPGECFFILYYYILYLLIV